MSDGHPYSLADFARFIGWMGFWHAFAVLGTGLLFGGVGFIFAQAVTAFCCSWLPSIPLLQGFTSKLWLATCFFVLIVVFPPLVAGLLVLVNPEAQLTIWPKLAASASTAAAVGVAAWLIPAWIMNR